ncbi:MAG: cell division protein FtsZ [Nitrososphaera sp.]
MAGSSGVTLNDLLLKNPILLVGIGGAGSKIAKSASATVGCRSILISNDKNDLADYSETRVLVDSGEWVNPSSYKLRSFAQLRRDAIKAAVGGFHTVIIISNLAGRAGSAIAPIVCKLAKDSDATVISVAIMPFKFEKDRLFNAGTALRRIRETSDSVIVMDNDAFLDNNPELSQEECYKITNSSIVEVITSISKGGIRPEINVLCTSRSASDSESSLRDTVAMLYQDIPDTAAIRRAMVYVMGGDKVPVGDLGRVASYVQGMFREEGATEVAMSSVASPDGVRVHLMASAPQTTIFDRYDPLGEIIPRENVLDCDEPDSAPDIELAIPNME